MNTKKIFAIMALATILLMEGGLALAATASDTACNDYCDKIKNGDPTATEPSGITCICSPIKYTSLSQLVKAVTNWIFWAALIIAPIMIIIGAFIFLTSAGVPARITLARNIMLWTSVGIAIIMGSKLIIALIKRILGA